MRSEHYQHPAHVHPPCPHCQGQHCPAPPRPREQVFASDPGRVVKSCHDVVTASGQVIVTVEYAD